MTTGQRIGVAISTTGDEHRLGFLETCVKAWEAVLPADSSLFITVDGSPEEAARVEAVLNAGREFRLSVFRVGQPRWSVEPYHQRVGVAVNKNTGLELLMDTDAEHLFLCDDDTWPLHEGALLKHTLMRLEHSMVCWGKSRVKGGMREEAFWTWPRGVLLYATRNVVETVGGMIEAFGVGAHEHAEWSQRIHNAGFTPEPFVTPASYAIKGAQGAANFWHCEDMPKPGEGLAQLGERRKALTSLRKADRDWDTIHAIMAAQEGKSDFVPYSAHENGRASATLCSNLSGQGDCATEPASRGSEK